MAARVAIVTGGSRGIGLAIAEAYAREGGRVVLAARGAAALEAAAASLRATGAEALAVPTDVADPAAVEALVATAIERFGRIDALVNCAGVYDPIGPVADLDPAEWARAVAVNLTGTFAACRYVLPHMLAAGQGAILNLSGGGGTAGRPNFAAYASSKAAVIRLTETIALEVARSSVRANAIAPGGVDTALIDAVIEAGGRAGEVALAEARALKSGGGVPMERVTDLAMFLLSDDSAGITGRLISAVWDDWRAFPEQAEAIAASDLYTLRRITPQIAP